MITRTFFERFSLLIFLFLLTSCREPATPKPYGFLRTDLPQPDYRSFENNVFLFDVSQLVNVYATDTTNGSWINLEYTSLDATVYVTHLSFPRQDDLYAALNDAHRIVTQSAGTVESLRAIDFDSPDGDVYARLYSLDLRSASPLQIVLTDSINNLFRAALYYDNPIEDIDSIAPIHSYIKNDVAQLVQTFMWNDSSY